MKIIKLGDELPVLPDRTEDIDASVGGKDIVVAFTQLEFAGIFNMIREALAAVDDWEFDTLVGLNVEEARDLQDQIGQVLRIVPVIE